MKKLLLFRHKTSKITRQNAAAKTIATLFVVAAFFIGEACAQGTWTKVTAPAPNPNFGGLIMLSDGSALCKSSGGGGSYGKLYNRLTPDNTGSYVNGTWSSIAAMHSDRLYYSSQLLMDGRLYVAGGEYGAGGSKGEVYDPLTDVWTAVTSSQARISDANSEILPDGTVLQAFVTSNLKKEKIFKPDSNKYSPAPDCIGIHNESSWVKLPDNSILMVDRGSTSSERYIPSLGHWVADATVPVQLYDGILETGPALLLPDGRVWHEGSTGHTAFYTPSGDTLPGSWVAGPDLPGGNGTDDAPMAMLPDGKILIAVAPIGGFNSPTKFYEFDYLTNTYTSLNCPDGKPSYNIPSYVTGMTVLPTGQVLVSFQDSSNYYIYTPAGAPIAQAKPVISTITQNDCGNTYTLTGTLFNGISEGACYGDDWQMATNYPVVRLTNGDKVYYGRTYNWNSTSVVTGNFPSSTQLALPANLPAGTYSLVVIANGIASDPIQFSTLSASIAANGSTTFCDGGTVQLIANSGVGFTYQWEKDGSAIPGETAATYSAGTSGDYSVVVTNAWGCDSLSNTINVTVNSIPAVSGSITNTSCATCSDGAVDVSETGDGPFTFAWSDGATTEDITNVLPGDYTVTVTSATGCSATATFTVVSAGCPGPPVPVSTTNITSTSAVANWAQVNGIGSYRVKYKIKTTSVWLKSSVNNQQVSYTMQNLQPNTTYLWKIRSVCGGGNNSDFSANQEFKTLPQRMSSESASEVLFNVLPNPASTTATIEAQFDNTVNLQIKITDVTGRIVFETSEGNVSSYFSHQIDVSSFAKGVYVVELNTGQEKYQQKLVVQ